MNVIPKDSVVARLREYGNRKRTTWEAAALCVSAISQIEAAEAELVRVRPIVQGAHDHMWRIAQGVADPQAYAKSVLKDMGIDFDAEQARLNALSG